MTKSLASIKVPIKTELKIFEKRFREAMRSKVPLLDKITYYIVQRKGKQIRPMFVFLSAQTCNPTTDSTYTAASFIELLHTASLVHDDVVDESELRRGRQTANELFGNQASVLVGDYLYTRAFQMMTELNNPEILKIFADTTNIISQGEVMQLMNVNDASTDETSYMQIINAKTAALFEATTKLAAMISGADQQSQDNMAEYGKCLGSAFQLADDALDYTADSETLGKNIGDDLAEGKPTLPLIIAMQKASTDEQAMIREAIEKGGLERLDEIQQVIKRCGGIEYTYQQAKKQAELAKKALADLPDTPHKQALLSLADFSISRTH